MKARNVNCTFAEFQCIYNFSLIFDTLLLTRSKLFRAPLCHLCFFADFEDEEKFVAFIHQFIKEKILDGAFKSETAFLEANGIFSQKDGFPFIKTLEA